MQIIYILEQGRVVGSGTHAELMKCNKYYQNFVEEQLYLEKIKKGTATT